MIIVHFTITPWDVGQVMSRQAMAVALAEHCPNIYVQINSVDLSSLFNHSRSDGNKTSQLEKITENLFIARFSPWYGNVYRLNALNDIQIRRQVKKLQGWINTIRKGNEPVIVYCWNYECARYIELLDYEYLVFHLYEDFFSYDQKNNERSRQQEHLLIEQADLVVVITEELARQKQIRRPWLRCESGVNTEIFHSNIDIPEKFTRLRCNGCHLVGYFGMVNEKIDFSLLYQLIKDSSSDYHFIFAGLEGQLKDENLVLWESIKNQANVVHLGPLHQREVAALCKLVDVGIMPYKAKTGWIKFGFPLKLFEFFACGTPVVGTPLPSLAGYSAFLPLVDTPTKFKDAIDQVIRNNSVAQQQKRITLARQNSWEKRAEGIIQILRNRFS